MKFYITEETNNYFCIWPEDTESDKSDSESTAAFFDCYQWLLANFGKEGVSNGWIAEPMLGFRIYKFNLEKIFLFKLTWM